MKNKNQLLARLASAYEYREEPFRLSSGQESHEYLDCRAALSDPATLQLAAHAMLDLLSPEIHAVGGMTMGADPLAVAVSLASTQKFRHGLRWFSVRKEPKKHGTGRLIEGFCKPNANVAVFEDVTTTGESALGAVRACMGEVMRVVQGVALVDRGGVPSLNGTLPAKAVLPFADIAVVGRARQIAIKAHGTQQYGAAGLYSATHLPAVVDVIAEMTDYEPGLMAAAWLHDSLEDTPETTDTLREQGVPGDVVGLVDACTDGEGRNRRERKERPFQLIPTVTNSVLIKLADRIANTEAARRDGKDDLIGMYRKEHDEFAGRLNGAPVSHGLDAAPFWARLSRALVST